MPGHVPQSFLEAGLPKWPTGRRPLVLLMTCSAAVPLDPWPDFVQPLLANLPENLEVAGKNLLAVVDPGREDWPDLAEAAAALRTPPGREPEDLARRHALLAALGEDLARRLRALAPPAAQAQLEARLAEQDWAGARHTVSSPARMGGEQVAAPASLPYHDRAASLPAPADPAAVPPWSPVWAAVDDGGDTAAALARARSAYTLVVASVIVVIGWVQFLDGWVGTWPDIGAAFAWGLGLDITGSLLFQLATQLRKGAGKSLPGEAT